MILVSVYRKNLKSRVTESRVKNNLKYPWSHSRNYSIYATILRCTHPRFQHDNLDCFSKHSRGEPAFIGGDDSRALRGELGSA